MVAKLKKGFVMKSTSNIGYVRRISRTVSIVLATLMLPGIAGADELMLSEITVVALAIDLDAVKSRTTRASIEDALDRVREQVRRDTDEHVRLTVEPPKSPKAQRAERIARVY